MDKQAEYWEKATNLFKGRIYCGDCGKRMRFAKENNGHIPIDQEYSYLMYSIRKPVNVAGGIAGKLM